MTYGPERVLTVAQELAEVSRLVEDDDVAGALQRFVDRVVRTVPGCAEATISVRTATGVDTVAATPGYRRPELDGEAGTDPIAEALRHAQPRRVNDSLTDDRWPRFSARLAGAGYRSCLVLPVPTQRSSLAVLTLLSPEPDQFTETVYDLARLLTLHAGVVFDNAQLLRDSRRLVEQLSAALEAQRMIGQAQGLLMHRFACSAEQGFDLLKGASQNTNTKLRQVASILVTAHEQDELAAVLSKFRMDPDALAPAGP